MAGRAPKATPAIAGNLLVEFRWYHFTSSRYHCKMVCEKCKHKPVQLCIFRPAYLEINSILSVIQCTNQVFLMRKPVYKLHKPIAVIYINQMMTKLAEIFQLQHSSLTSHVDNFYIYFQRRRTDDYPQHDVEICL